MGGRCVDRPQLLSRFSGLIDTSRKSVKQMIGYSKIEHPSSRTRLICSLDGTNFDALGVPLDLATKGTNLPRVRTQDLMVQLQEYHRMGQSSGPYPYSALTLGAPINLLQLSTAYQIASREITYHDFQKEIQRVTRLPPNEERYTDLFPSENSGLLV